MRTPSFRSALPALSVVLCLVAGCLATLPLATWLWWAVSPLKLYYIDAYFSSTMARGNSTAAATVEWLYKSSPGRADQLVEESDVVADTPGNRNDLRLPMHLSSAARNAGWSALIRGPRVQINAAKLEPFLRDNFYDDRSFWRLFEQPILIGMLFVIVALAARDWFGGRARKERAGRSVTWPESLPESRRNRRLGGAQFRWLVRPGSLRIVTSKDILKRAAHTVFQAVRKGGGRRGELVDGFRSGVEALTAEVTPSSATAKQPEASLLPGKEMQVSPTVQNANQSLTAATNSNSSSYPKKRANRHLIFPGAQGAERANHEPRSWDESQWID